MDSDMMDEDSVFDVDDSGSDRFEPEPKSKAIAKKKTTVAKAPAPKKMKQTTLKPKAAAGKKRSLPDDSEDEGTAVGDSSILSNTPPSAKKQKKTVAPKKGGGNPLQELDNDMDAMDGQLDGPSKGKKKASDQYQKLTQLEHIIKRPDTYIGSIEMTESTMWVFNSDTEQMEYRKVNYVPGLYKIFDEILVNAADNKQNDKNMKNIKVTVDRDEGIISIENDGRGIPVEMHSKEKIYIPEMIFGHLLTSSNYDDDQAKTTGGRNGYGAKLCNIFSTEFTLETADGVNGKKYVQTWTNNMSNMGKAKISSSKSNYTKVTFKPDWAKFRMSGIDDDFEALVKRRVYDMAGTVKGVKVSLNGNVIKVNTFKKYIEMYSKAIDKERGLEVTEPAGTVIIDDNEAHPRWEIGFAVSDGGFNQVSFVNNISTTSGGTHVNHIADQICNKLAEVVKKKNPKGAALKNTQIRNHIFLFVNCLITNPSFNSQTKEQLTTKSSQFGSKCPLTDAFLKKIGQTDAVANILNFAEKKADQALAKSDGNKRSRMNNAKLVDANLAGTKRGHECTLILTEGDSAKALAVAGRAILDPDKIGVFPLRGKLLNVRDASIDQISKNAEIQNIKQFLGLKHKTNYTDCKSLRYGHLMIMADQDHDGSHIKGLLINFLQVQFPSLLKIPDFFREFITPIVKVWKGNVKKMSNMRTFFTMPEYEAFKESHKDERGWDHKYYKGLGTSDSKDAQVYFTDLDKHLKDFQPMKLEEEALFELAFSKKKADARKQWLGEFVPGTFLDHSTKKISYNDFVNKELILFSMADNMRSIPSVLDGFKPGQRKVLYTCFKTNLVKDRKVVELAGEVMGGTAYAHGETSMQMTIVGLAQNFIGSNNVNCLEPSGNFGSRLQGGSDAASARYIYTRLTPFARRIFSVHDEPLLTYNTDDDRLIEPQIYAPIIPMVLINGAEGIGTGWSTNIPNYSPEDVIENLKRRMGRLDGDEEKPFEPMVPWYKGWKGEIEAAGPDRYKCNGIIRELSDTEVEITELPLKVWTDDFKEKLEVIIKGEKGPSFIKDYKEYNDHQTVHFTISLDEKHTKKVLEEGLIEKFKLSKQIATSNLVAFDTQGRIRKYEKVEDILEEFYEYRMDMYHRRKKHQLEVMHAEYRKLTNQARFVSEIIEGTLVVSKKKKKVLVTELKKRNYEAFPKVSDAKKKGETAQVVENEEEEDADDEAGARDYDYLLGMPIWSLTQERVDKLKENMIKKKLEFEALEKLSEKDIWCNELDDFLAEWKHQLQEEADVAKKIRGMGRRVSHKIGAGGGKAKGRAKKVEEDDYAPKAKKKSTVIIEKKVSAGQAKLTGLWATSPKTTKPKYAVDGSMSDDDEDFAGITAAKPSTSRSTSRGVTAGAVSRDVSASMQPDSPGAGRKKRAAAAKPKAWLEDDSDEEASGDDMLGDINALVKGIGKDSAEPTSNTTTGRVSLYGMSRAGGSIGGQALKKKPSKAFNFDDDDENDETNYEMLARSSPQKSAPPKDDIMDSLLSDEDEVIPVSKRASIARPAAKKALPVDLDEDEDEDDDPFIDQPKTAGAGKTNAKTVAAPAKKAPTKIDSDDEDMPPPAKLEPKKRGRKPKQKVMTDDDDLSVAPKKPAAKVAAKKAAPVPKKKEPTPALPPTKPAILSPAAKAYAAKQAKAAASTKTAPPAAKSSRMGLSDSEHDDDASEDEIVLPKKAANTKIVQSIESDEDDESIVVKKPAVGGRGRPARAAVVKKPVYVVDSDDEEEEEDEESALVVDDDEEEDSYM